jgi:hypothetical protein
MSLGVNGIKIKWMLISFQLVPSDPLILLDSSQPVTVIERIVMAPLLNARGR